MLRDQIIMVHSIKLFWLCWSKCTNPFCLPGPKLLSHSGCLFYCCSLHLNAQQEAYSACAAYKRDKWPLIIAKRIDRTWWCPMGKLPSNISHQCTSRIHRCMVIWALHQVLESGFLLEYKIFIFSFLIILHGLLHYDCHTHIKLCCSRS